MPTKTSPRLNDDQLAEMLELLRESDSVELKLTVPERTSARRSPRSASTRSRRRSARSSSSTRPT